MRAKISLILQIVGILLFLIGSFTSKMVIFYNF